MLFLKRLATSLVLFVFLFVVLYIGSLAVGGGIAGARAGREHPEVKDFKSGYEAGQQAGAEFARKYSGIIAIAALGVSGVASLALSFGGVLPWCRRTPQPPQLPNLGG